MTHGSSFLQVNVPSILCLLLQAHMLLTILKIHQPYFLNQLRNNNRTTIVKTHHRLSQTHCISSRNMWGKLLIEIKDSTLLLLSSRIIMQIQRTKSLWSKQTLWPNIEFYRAPSSSSLFCYVSLLQLLCYRIEKGI